MSLNRILLSVPHMGGTEERYVREAFSTNWISTVGPNLTAFEAELGGRLGQSCVALGSGTAAIHLGLRLLDVSPGDDVLCSSLTFVASVNPIVYLGARPVFIDSERRSWNLDPALVAESLRSRIRRGRRPKAVVVVHLFGQTADMTPILETCREHEVPVLEDAAEALGSLHQGRPAGTLGDLGTYSFNGNKIITTSGGGALSSSNPALVEKARHWSTQAREPRVEYHHVELGYNYRLSNVLAGIGRGQLEVLDERVSQRRAIAFRYRDAFRELPGIEFMPQAPWGLHTNWLSCFLIDARDFGMTRDQLIRVLDEAAIESRPIWKPMHLQPLYRDAECAGGAVATDLYERGICLPSSSSLSEADQTRVIERLVAASRSARR